MTRPLRSSLALLLAAVATAALCACGDDASGTGGAGGGAGGAGGVTSAGGAGGEGPSGGGGSGGSAAPSGVVEWTFDQTAHVTTDGQPPTAQLQKASSSLSLSISAVDPVVSATLNFSLSVAAGAEDVSIPAGSYPCAPANQLPTVTVSAAEGSIVATSVNAGYDCTLVLSEDVLDGGPVRGSLEGNLSDGGTTYPLTATFDLLEPAR
jgi:hypothetical protein